MDYQDGTEKWESLILKEVIPTLRKKYGLRKDKGGTLIGGYSMGGMGSLRIAFKHPKRFGAVAAIAPAIEPAYQFKDIQPRDREYRSDAVYERIYGKPVDHDFWQANHPPTLARDRAGQIKDSKLKVYFEVGDADELGLFRGGEFLHDTLLQKNVSHEYRLVHGAEHEGDTLPSRLADAVRFLGRVSGGVDAQMVREVQQHMDRYIELFNDGRAEAIGRQIYRAPVLMPRPSDPLHTILESTVDVQKHFADTFTKIKGKGWKRSTVHDFTIRTAGTDIAFYQMTFSRLRADGEAIPPARRIANYVLVKNTLGWRIISVSSQPEPVGPATPQAVKEVEAHMERYVELCNKDAFEKIAHEIYHAPVLWRVNERVALDMTSNVIRDRFDSAWKGFKLNGLKQMVLHNLDIRFAGPNMAFVDMHFTRVKADGTAMSPGRRTWSYVLLKREAGWRIVSDLGQAPPAN
jgi:pimeloyl-ACP methyl ester carboxylesterase